MAGNHQILPEKVIGLKIHCRFVPAQNRVLK